MGASVKLTSGPVSLKSIKAVETEYVETSEEMLNAVMSNADNFDILISTAAIADYKPKDYSKSKYKKSENDITIKFTRGADIISAASKKNKDIYTVGFAAETEALEKNAQAKLIKKNLDCLLYTSPSPRD